MSKKYLDENGVKILWNKTKEKIAESCVEVNTKVDVNTAGIEELNTKVDAIEALSTDEINEVLLASTLITFYIKFYNNEELTELQAEEGMTWSEFVESEYNPTIENSKGTGFIKCFTVDEATFGNKLIGGNQFNYVYINEYESGNPVLITDTIVAGTTYVTL